jgi:nucleoside permease NupC
MGRFTGLIGIFIILGLVFLWSNNRKKINYRLVITGLVLQISIAVFILNRRSDLARLGFKDMLCETMASYISASLAGIIF